MKAALHFELFGENNREYFRLYRHIFELFDHQQTFDDLVGGVPPRSSWVAEITGPDETYGLRREFLRPKLDYSRANAKGSRGIFAEYILESGHIYDLKARSYEERFYIIYMAAFIFDAVHKNSDVAARRIEKSC